MAFIFGIISVIILFLGSLTQALTLPLYSLKRSLPIHTVFQFDSSGIWIENIAARDNGDLIITILEPAPLLYLIENPASLKPKTTLLHNFTGIDGVLGITQIRPDAFVVVGGNYSGSVTNGVQGSFAAFEVILPPLGSHVASVRNITSIPDATFLNGATTVCENVVLIADSALGAVFRLDTATGQYEKPFSYSEMLPVAGGLVPIGINGVHVRDGYLYFSNSGAEEIYRIAITAQGYPVPNANIEVLTGTVLVDDFTIGTDGTIWACANIGNTVMEIKEVNGVYQPAVIEEGASDQLTVAGATAAVFGRGLTDRDILYVVTDGGLGNPINGTITEPGKVVAVDTKASRVRGRAA